jgi:hypothetical protein
MSAFLPLATELRTFQIGSFVPEAESLSEQGLAFGRNKGTDNLRR